jgi:hypothetical protein
VLDGSSRAVVFPVSTILYSSGINSYFLLFLPSSSSSATVRLWSCCVLLAAVIF